MTRQRGISVAENLAFCLISLHQRPRFSHLTFCQQSQPRCQVAIRPHLLQQPQAPKRVKENRPTARVWDRFADFDTRGPWPLHGCTSFHRQLNSPWIVASAE